MVEMIDILHSFKVESFGSVPSVIDEDGTLCWFNANGRFHRMDGPAIEEPDGAKQWWENGKYIREEYPEDD